MAFEAPIQQDYDPEKTMLGPAAGKYHVCIVKVDEDGGKNGEMIVDYEVLAGSTPGQEGLVHRDYFSKKIKAMGRIHQLAMACHMITAQQINDLKEKGQSPSYDFVNDAVGKHIHVDLQDDEYNGKIRVKCGFGIFAVDDPKVASWPKNHGMLKSAGIAVEAPAGTEGGATGAAGSGAAEDKSQVGAGILDGVV